MSDGPEKYPYYFFFGRAHGSRDAAKDEEEASTDEKGIACIETRML
jgi:hypothetical protein